jgi:dTDP-4-dehydrorhamnose reductase
VRILVTGASGLLGNRVVELALQKGHDVISGYKDHVPVHGKPLALDLTRPAEVWKTFSELHPDVVINTAAMTDVDRCELEPEAAFSANSKAVSNISDAAKEVGSFVVQVSTDYVFDGERGGYSEDDETRPVNKYGESKLEGEKVIMHELAKETWSIARSSVIYGWGRSGRPNAATFVYEKLSKGESIRIARDVFASPTLNTSLSSMLIEIAERQLPGIIHVAGATRLSRFHFATGLAKTFGLDTSLIRAVRARDLRWTAKRPADSSLKVGRAQKLLRSAPLHIEKAYEALHNEHITSGC